MLRLVRAEIAVLFTMQSRWPATTLLSSHHAFGKT